MIKRLFSKRTLKYVLFGLSYIGVFALGMYAYKNEAVRSKILGLKKPLDFSYDKYSSGSDAMPEVLELIIPDSAMNNLQSYRDSAVAEGYLKPEFKQEILATMIWRNDSIPTKVRLKGDFPDHWSGEKWSMRLNIKGEHSLLGMDKFSIQAPETRKSMNEWYYHQHLKHAGILGLRYRFIKVSINGEDKGVFALEEAFSKELLENAQRKDAPILKFDESSWINQIRYKDSIMASETDYFYTAPVTLFSASKTFKDPVKYNQFLKGKALLEAFRNGEKSVGETFDLKQTAQLFAIAELTGSYHGMRWHNQRFYYNPFIDRLEMIGFDSGSGERIEGTRYDLWANGKMTEYHGLMAWKQLFFQDEEFVETYFNCLENIVSADYLSKVNNQIADKMNDQLAMLYSEDSFYEFDTSVYRHNNDIIAASIEKHQVDSKTPHLIEPIRFSMQVDSSGNGELFIENTSPQELQLLELTSNTGEFLIDLHRLAPIAGKRTNFRIQTETRLFNFNPPVQKHWFDSTAKASSRFIFPKILITYKLGHSNVYRTAAVSKFETSTKVTTEPTAYLDYFDQQDVILTLKSPQTIIDSDIIVPKGLMIRLNKGDQIDLIKGCQLTTFSPVDFRGSEDEKINLFSSDSSGSFLISSATKGSYISHTDFSHLNGSDRQFFSSGGVCVYNSNITIENTTFSKMQSEDALNLIRSTFELKNVSFTKTFSDAIDVDFGEGTLKNISFNRIGNDAIDLSGSKVRISQVVINHCQDKGLSAGEGSTVAVNALNIHNSEIGIVAKDRSIVLIAYLKLKNVKLAATAFQKKREYGPSLIRVKDTETLSIIQSSYLLEPRSTIGDQEKNLDANCLQVIDKLYGNDYGKSTEK